MEDKNKESVYIGLEKVLLKSEREERRKKIKRIIITIVLCMFFLVIGIAGGYLAFNLVHPIDGADSKNTFGEIEAVLRNFWIYNDEYEDLQKSLEDKAFYGMTTFEEDPYTTYMSEEELEEFAGNINMDYVGIGIQYSMIGDNAMVEKVFINSPAEKAGIISGDIITKVDGVSIDGLTSDEIKEKVLGEEGTNVVITITRKNKSYDVTVTRAAIDSSVYCYSENDYVVLQLSSFGENTGKECMNYLDQYTDYQKIVIDLRDNTGGYQTSVQEIAGLFIGNGEVYLKQKDTNGFETDEYTKCEKTYTNFKKIILLVNQNTASAAEVFTICLKEQLDNVTVVGTTTFGKGVIQTTRPLLNGGVLKFSSYYWYSPKGLSIHKIGIKPDIEIKLDEKYYKTYLDSDDNQLQEAIKYIVGE